MENTLGNKGRKEPNDNGSSREEDAGKLLRFDK
jgi:hypothetical protein